MQTALYVALGGAAGALGRWGLGLAAARVFGPGVPAGTWAANLLGCFLIGLALPSLGPGHPHRALVVTGLLGAFTTFSTYTADTLLLWEAGRPGLAALNAVGSVAAGLAVCAVGLAVGRAVAG